MSIVIRVLILCMITSSVFAQDTLVLKDGTIIRVNLVEAGTKIIKFKKFDDRKDSSVYIIPADSIIKIKYLELFSEDYSLKDGSFSPSPDIPPHKKAYNPKVLAFAGVAGSLFNTYRIGSELEEYWQNITISNDIPDGGTSSIKSFEAGFMMQWINERNFLGVKIGYVRNNAEVVKATYEKVTGTDEIYLNNSYFCISLAYQIFLDKSIKLSVPIDVSMIIGSTSGKLFHYTEPREISGTDLGWNFSTGLSYRFLRYFETDLRIGYRSLKIEPYAVDSKGSYYLYVNLKDGNKVELDFSGVFLLAGLKFNIPLVK